jgi:hypothetical protein
MSDEDPAQVAARASATARAALIIACVAIALAIFGLFLPVDLG